MNKLTLITIHSVFLSLLAGCGGQSSSTTSIKLGSTPAPLETSAFLTIANDNTCANLQNRLFLIDQQYVLSEKLGNCSDARYRQTLFGKTPETILCTNADSIAGPRYSCSDPAAAAIFKQAIEHLDYPDLGLGSNHQVQQINVPTSNETNLRITALGTNLFYGKAPTNIVIKDEKLWGQFVNFGKFKTPQKLNLDFNTEMIVGSFFKSPNNCSQEEILKVSSTGQKIIAQYQEKNIVSIASCDKTSNMESTPMSLVSAPRLALPVEFVDISSRKLAYDEIETSSHSLIGEPRAVLIKDQATWSALWQEHNAVMDRPIPVVDFSKRMLIAVFMGNKPNGCYGIPEINVWRYNNRINVSYRDGQAPIPEDTLCAAVIMTPVRIVAIDRSEESVDFTTIPVVY